MNPREEAEKLMVAYFRTVTTQAGGRWTQDNTEEVKTMVGFLLDAAMERAMSAVRYELKKQAGEDKR